MKILLATRNPGKVAEIRAMLDLDVEWTSLSDFSGINEIKEDGETFAENARKKSLGYAKQTGLWTIADDSGLSIDALGGQPGVTSARFSGTKEKNRKLLDHKNMAKVLKLLKGVPRENGSTSSPSRAKSRERTARFVCHLCLASAEKILIETEGRFEGLIAEKEIGKNGFGYDPIFFVPNLNKTVAQLTREEKNAISHRGNAIRKLKPQLDKLLQAV
ncbi:MAG: RdgB/HAM1 family non-canonical purine NTP pyrophosphatase [Sedimentisphaerales bacterium]|nr:RdgB/HAM1 family non-canonical purine NTP pyrophosphatase [Sedimentisphaerales bacterium]